MVKFGVASYVIERASGLAKRTIERNKDNNRFSTENNREYDTIQPMKYSVQQEVQPHPKFEQDGRNAKQLRMRRS